MYICKEGYKIIQIANFLLMSLVAFILRQLKKMPYTREKKNDSAELMYKNVSA